MTDLDGRNFVRRGNALVPADFAAEEMLTEIGEGREVIVTARKARNPRFHRWFFAMLRKVIENTDDRWMTEEDLLDDLKLAVGHTRTRVDLLTGEVCKVPRSIAFAKMEQLAFKRFVNRCIYVLSKVLGISPDVLMEEVNATQHNPPFTRADLSHATLVPEGEPEDEREAVE